MVINRLLVKTDSVPTLFRLYEAGSAEVVDLAHMLEPIHNKDGERDFAPGELIMREGDAGRGRLTDSLWFMAPF